MSDYNYIINLDKLNDIIKKNNTICDNLETEKDEYFHKLELYYAYEFNKDNNYFNTIDRIQELKDEIDKINNELRDNNNQILIYESQLLDINIAAENINDFLKSMFGKEHIKIEVSNNRFMILRDNIKAKNLSSGEKTAIAFSYFLTKLGDKDTNPTKTIVFIDDPISSLDENHLYNTFALINNHITNYNQIFISTHNHDFFNLIKDCFKDLKDKQYRYYLIERITINENEHTILSNLPKLLEKYKSEYHYLFYKIKTFYDNPSTDYDSLYQLPNILRRFLEAFIGFKYSTGLKKGLQNLIKNENDLIKVYKFINEYSHQHNFNRSIKFYDSDECHIIVDIVINTIKYADPVHYKTLENIYLENNS